MCVSPSYVFVDRGPSVERVEVACGWCWSCQKNRLNDIVGRVLCEMSTADWVRVVTLTYRPSDYELTPELLQLGHKNPQPLQIRTIQKSDFQNFMKWLRRRFRIRYLVAGEYGSRATERVHFHAILMGRGKPPTWELHKNIHIKQWPWGHVYVDDAASEQSVRYAAKYLLKGAKRRKSRHDNRYNKEWISYSRIPIMGIDVVLNLAERYASERVVPHSFKYRPPMAHEGREYQFTGEARYRFIEHLITLWPDVLNKPKTPAMENAFLRYTKERQRRQWEALPAATREKLLDSELQPRATLNQRDTRLTGEFLARRMEEEKIGTISEFKARYPEDYAVVARAYRRDLTVSPPNLQEAGHRFEA